MCVCGISNGHVGAIVPFAVTISDRYEFRHAVNLRGVASGRSWASTPRLRVGTPIWGFVADHVPPHIRSDRSRELHPTPSKDRIWAGQRRKSSASHIDPGLSAFLIAAAEPAKSGRRSTTLPETGSSGHSPAARTRSRGADGHEAPKPASTPTGAVFLSYASQNADAAERLAESLRSA